MTSRTVSKAANKAAPTVASQRKAEMASLLQPQQPARPRWTSMVKVRHFRQTRTRVLLIRPGEMNPHLLIPCITFSFARATPAAGDQDNAKNEPAAAPEQGPAPVSLAELSRRAAIMFSGKTGAVVASGDSGVTTAPTYELVINVTTVIGELPDDLSLIARLCARAWTHRSLLLITPRESSNLSGVMPRGRRN